MPSVLAQVGNIVIIGKFFAKFSHLIKYKIINNMFLEFPHLEILFDASEFYRKTS